MALKIRFRQQGRANRQTYRLVVTDIRHPRDGKYVESLGSYNPFATGVNFTLNEERLQYWIGQGALLTDAAKDLIKATFPSVATFLEEKARKKRLKVVQKRKASRKKEVAETAAKVEKKPSVKKKKSS